MKGKARAGGFAGLDCAGEEIEGEEFHFVAIALCAEIAG